MAQYSYDQYSAQQAKRGANSSGKNGPDVHFMNEYLKNDGDVVVVRFPYHTMNDVTFETTHSVTFPGKSYPSRVRCEGDNCPLCAEGINVDVRFFAKAIAYVVNDDGEVSLQNVVWDRPSAFADIDIKNLMQEYGDLADQLFKIKRNGIGKATRYTISIIMNKTVYNPEVYKADFSELDQVDPVKILTKTYAQYEAAKNPDAAPVQTTAPKQQAPVYTAPAQPVQQQVEQPAPARQQTRYTF